MEGADQTLLGSLHDRDRQKLGEAVRCLLAHGSVLGLDGTSIELYHWCDQNASVLEDVCRLLDIRLHWDNVLRFVQAIPERGSFLLRLTLDETLVLLTLWYEFDTAIRDRGETPPVSISVQQLNDLFGVKFPALRRQLPSKYRMRRILSLAQRKNIIRCDFSPEFEHSLITILPTVKRIIPFPDLAEWSRHAERLLLDKKDGYSEEQGDAAEDME